MMKRILAAMALSLPLVAVAATGVAPAKKAATTTTTPNVAANVHSSKKATHAACVAQAKQQRLHGAAAKAAILTCEQQ